MTVATLGIESPGTYLLMGFIDLDKSITNGVMNAQINTNIVPSKYLFPCIRTIADGGGGACVMGYVVADEPFEVYVISYGYHNESYRMRGSITAIRLA